MLAVDIEDGFGGELFLSVAEGSVRRGVELEESSLLGVDHPDGLGCLVDQCREDALALDQRLALGDVRHRPDHAHRATLLPNNETAGR